MGVDPHSPAGRAVRPYPERLRDQLEGIIWRFRTGSPWRDVPETFGSWSSVYDRFAQWRDAGAFATAMEAMIAEAARRGQTDLSLVSEGDEDLREGTGLAEAAGEPDVVLSHGLTVAGRELRLAACDQGSGLFELVHVTPFPVATRCVLATTPLCHRCQRHIAAAPDNAPLPRRTRGMPLMSQVSAAQRQGCR
ncbi:hypothetical protein DKG71_35260 [Streptomyces sp. NEAU-S7GS2]|nr:hypothetical protein DKG71_35260 [Streptomyces sp. NEAU-S7GS2]